MALRLQNILFETSNVGDGDFVDALTKSFVSSFERKKSEQHNGTAMTLAVEFQIASGKTQWRPFDINLAHDVATAFVEQAKGHLQKAIPADAVSFQFVGAGAVGLAFGVVDADDHEYILKLEVDNFGDWRDQISSAPKFNKVLNAQRKGRSAGSSQPMIYDSGSFTVFRSSHTKGTQVNWILLQKFELEVDSVHIQELRNQIVQLFDAINIVYSLAKASRLQTRTDEIEFGRLGAITKTMNFPFGSEESKKQLAAYVRKRTGEKNIKLVDEFLRLAPDWVEVLVEDVINMALAGLKSDFHIGNVGIQRNGPEGYFKFFD
jgi:hypothetical protein